MNIAKMMKQAQQMQSELQKAQEEIASQSFEGVSGGGAVKVTANGEGRLLAVTVSPEVLKESDPEMLGDLLLVAANGAIDAGKEATRVRMSKLTAGMGLPPGMGL